MAQPVRILPHYTYDDYCKWEGQWELIEGIPHAMSPAPVLRHQQIANSLGGELHLHLKKCGGKCKASQFVDYVIADDTVLQPDVVVYCGNTKAKYLDFAPALLAEILSPATALKDRHTKYSLYEAAGVKYYLIINPANETVEVFELVEKKYKLTAEGHAFKHSFNLQDACTAEIDFAEIW
jgi:Uma2 family endonuclease